MKDLFQHVGAVETKDTYDEALAKIRTSLQNCTNIVVQSNLLFANLPQSTRSFEKWSKEISNAAKLIDFAGYNWKQAAVDEMILQTSSPKLRVRKLSSRKCRV